MRRRRLARRAAPRSPRTLRHEGRRQRPRQPGPVPAASTRASASRNGRPDRIRSTGWSRRGAPRGGGRPCPPRRGGFGPGEVVVSGRGPGGDDQRPARPGRRVGHRQDDEDGRAGRVLQCRHPDAGRDRQQCSWLQRRRRPPRRRGTSGGVTASTAARHAGPDADVGDSGELRLRVAAPLGADLRDHDDSAGYRADASSPPSRARPCCRRPRSPLVAHRLTRTDVANARAGRRSRLPRCTGPGPLMGVATTAKGKAGGVSPGTVTANPMRSKARKSARRSRRACR